jgi:hypothetical protein
MQESRVVVRRGSENLRHWQKRAIVSSPYPELEAEPEDPCLEIQKKK